MIAKKIIWLFSSLLVVFLNYEIYYYLHNFFVFFLTFVQEKKILLLSVIFFIDILFFKKKNYETILINHHSLYYFRQSNKELYRITDFIIDFFYFFKKEKIKKTISIFFTFMFFFSFKKILISSLAIFISVLVFYTEWYCVTAIFLCLFKIEHSFKININKFNLYNIKFIHLIQWHLYYYPKTLAFVTNYFFFSTKTKKKEIGQIFLKNFYYRLIGIPLIIIKIIAFVFTSINDIILQIEWSQKHSLVWPFIFLYEIIKTSKYKINEKNSSLFGFIRGRRINIKKKIETNSSDIYLLKYFMNAKYKSLYGAKIKVRFGIWHKQVMLNQNINDSGASFGTTFTHAQTATFKPYYTDEKIQMPSHMINALDKQYGFTGFVDNNLLKWGSISSYEKKHLNDEQEFLYKLPSIIQQIQIGYKTLMENTPFLYQESQAKIIATIQELESKNCITKSSAKIIKEIIPNEYEQMSSQLLKKYDDLNVNDIEAVINKSIQTIQNMDISQKVDLFVETMIDNDDLPFTKKNDMILMINGHKPF